MSAEEPPRGANSTPAGGSAAAEPQAWGDQSLIAVTGANGFIGSALCARATRDGRAVRRIVHARRGPDDLALDLAHAGPDELARALEGVSTIVHLAGRAHVMHDTAPDSSRSYREANEQATRRLASAACGAGVRRFIFASTVKVNGEATKPGRPFRPGDPPAPDDAYAASKHAAEVALADAAHGMPMNAIVLRLPLVYGPGARGNFRRLVEAVRSRRWLPFGALDNRRSLIGIDNLLDALDAAADASNALDGVHFVADADSVSMRELVQAIARALHATPRLVPVPAPVLEAAGFVTGRRDMIMRITRSLEVDTTSFRAATGWRPRPFAIDAATVRPPADAVSLES